MFLGQGNNINNNFSEPQLSIDHITWQHHALTLNYPFFWNVKATFKLDTINVVCNSNNQLDVEFFKQENCFYVYWFSYNFINDE